MSASVDERRRRPPPLPEGPTQLDVDPRWGIRCDASMALQLELAEEEFICGEVFDKREDGSFLRLFPPVERVSQKFGVPRRILEEIAVRNDWVRQRARFAAQVRDELRSMQAKVKAVTTEEAIETLDKYIRKFAEKVESGHVVMDSISDLDKALRLKAFLKGDPDSRKETHNVITLAEIQARYRVVKDEEQQVQGPMTGVIEDGSESMRDHQEIPENFDVEGIDLDSVFDD